MATITNRVLWWALVASLLIYIAVAHLVHIPPNPSARVGKLLPIFVVISIGTGIGSLLYRRHALSRPIQAGELDLSRAADAQKAFQPFVVNLVLSESIGIYGLVLSFMSGRPAYSIAFGAAALSLMYLHRPTASDVAPPPSGSQRSLDPTPFA